MENYINIKIRCQPIIFEIIAAELSEVGFEGFLEGDDFIEAYIPEHEFNRQVTVEILDNYNINLSDCEVTKLPQQNWNQIWENSFDPVVINNEIIIRSPFHKINKHYKYNLLIQPKTSFGTGHHATTNLVLQVMLNINFNHKTVLDFGCGTGILSVFASMLGAEKIFAIDIDNWASENILENTLLNNIYNVFFTQTNLEHFVLHNKYHIILVNINKNVLLNSFKKLSDLLADNGFLVISGFYEEDIEELCIAAKNYQLTLTGSFTKDNWCAALLSKTN